MATFVKFQPFAEAVYEKVHDFGSDTFMIALANAANAPSTGWATLSQVTQISYTNLGSRALTVASSSQSGGTYKWTVTDKVLTASGGSVAAFRYLIVYNDTAASDNLVGYYDYGSEQTLADTETFTIDFDGTNGVIQHA